MASLYRSGESYCVRFRFQGQAYRRTLKTTSLVDARQGNAIVEQTLYRLRTGQLQLRPDVDLADFIVSGGTLTPPPPAPAPEPEIPSLVALIEAYQGYVVDRIAPSYFNSQKTHLRHFVKYLQARAQQPWTAITDQDIQGFLDRQLRSFDPNTVNKQRITLVQFYKWVVKNKRLLAHSPMREIEAIKYGYDRPPFRTLGEIQAIITRGGLTAEQELGLWECLYLDPTEIAGLLQLVREQAQFECSPVLHAIPAYTGMRRGEVLKLQWMDVDLEHGMITARSRKQSRSRREVTRRIDLHPELRTILEEWRRSHTRGQYVLNHEQRWEPLSADHANRRFWQPMRGSQWCLDAERHWYKIGFHTYRHSFASNLAAANIDARIIDEFMGHTTEAMRKRYRHLFPSRKREAIRCFTLLGSDTAAIGSDTAVNHSSTQPSTTS